MAKKDLTVTKSNALIEARYKLNVVEQKVILGCIALLDPRKAMPESITITADKYIQIYGGDMANAYRHLNAAADSLLERQVIIQVDKNVSHKAVWVSESHYDKHGGKLKLWLSPTIRSYLGGIKSNFTKYELNRIAQLNSSYSIRLFEILIRFNDTGERTVNLDKFREQLGLAPELYPRFPDFRRRVLDAAIKELNHKTNLVIEYQALKTGKKITAIKFDFHEAAQQILPLENLPPELEGLKLQ
jgi:plasmid replication initiation protein